MRERKGFENVERTDRPAPRPSPEDPDRREGESRKAYELRKAMEATTGGDTRTDRTRY